MPYVSSRRPGLFNMKEAAERNGYSPSRFHELVYELQVVPPPNIISGKRRYYDPDALIVVGRAVERHKARNVAK